MLLQEEMKEWEIDTQSNQRPDSDAYPDIKYVWTIKEKLISQARRIFESLTGIPINGRIFLIISFAVSKCVAAIIKDCIKQRKSITN